MREDSHKHDDARRMDGISGVNYIACDISNSFLRGPIPSVN